MDIQKLKELGCDRWEAYSNALVGNDGLYYVTLDDGSNLRLYPYEVSPEGCCCQSCKDRRDAALGWESVPGGEICEHGKMWRYRAARGVNPSGSVLSREDAIAHLNA